MLVELCGRPGSGKTTLSRALADAIAVVLLRVDAIEAALASHQISAEQSGIAAYSVMHAIAAPHLARGQLVVVDACSPVWQARQGWVDLASRHQTELVVVEVVCPDRIEHRRRVDQRVSDLDHFEVPTWAQVEQAEYQPRTDPRRVIDSTARLADQLHQLLAHLGLADAGSRADQSPAMPPRS